MKTKIRLAVVLALALASHSAYATPTAPQTGTDFTKIEKPLQTSASKKIDVVEFFAYFCPHCNAFDAPLKEWAKAHQESVNFTRVHASFRSEPDPQQRLFYTLQALGKLEEFHPKIMAEIHGAGNALNTEEAIVKFMAKNGIDERRFLDTYRSPQVTQAVEQARKLQADRGIKAVPLLMIDGRYVTGPGYFHKKKTFFEKLGAVVSHIWPGSTNKKESEHLEQQYALQVTEKLVNRAQKEHMQNRQVSQN
jgi:thiol:disulfide interchange protein DsbA